MILDRILIKEVQNITTKVDDLCFNYTGEILAAYSSWKRNALKLIHLKSQTVFMNWPNIQTNLQKVSAIAFSPNSKFLSVGNDEGALNIYTLSHYI